MTDFSFQLKFSCFQLRLTIFNRAAACSSVLGDLDNLLQCCSCFCLTWRGWSWCFLESGCQRAFLSGYIQVQPVLFSVSLPFAISLHFSENSPVTGVTLGPVSGWPPRLLMRSASLGRSSVLIHLQLKVCKGFVSHWLGCWTFWTLEYSCCKGTVKSPCQDLKETKWSTFYCKSFSTAHIGISSFNMIYFFIQSNAVKNVCIPLFLSAPRSLHLP